MKFNIDTKMLKKEAIIRSIKMLDIGILTILFFILGYSLSWTVNKMYNDFNTDKEHSKVKIFFEVCGQLFVIGIMVYIIRNIVQAIPFPLDGYFGYDHSRVRELYSGGIAIAFGIFYAQENIKSKINYVFS